MCAGGFSGFATYLTRRVYHNSIKDALPVAYQRSRVAYTIYTKISLLDAVIRRRRRHVHALSDRSNLIIDYIKWFKFDCVKVSYPIPASALQCWKCSSDIDRTCADPFNETEINSRRGGNFYDSLQPNYNQGQNYNPQFNPGYNPNYRDQTPTLETCNDNEANLKRMKNVCIKKTIRGEAV